MVEKKIYALTLSLAGICQAVYLVQKLAQIGYCNNKDFSISLKSILEINPSSILTIYGNHEKNIHLGLKTLLSILTVSNFSFKNLELIKYIFNIIFLEKKLQNNIQSRNILKKHILTIKNNIFINHENIDILTIKFAELYLNVISSLGSRIKIKGEKRVLQNFQVQAKIRCMLLAGIRSVVLWKQLGGYKLQCIFFRKKIIQKVSQILSNLT